MRVHVDVGPAMLVLQVVLDLQRQGVQVRRVR